jgi:hypothetical protein
VLRPIVILRISSSVELSLIDELKSSPKETMNQAGVNMEDNQPEAATRIRANQEKLAARVLLSRQTLATELKPHYDFIVCGSGFSGSVVQRRLAENSGVSVLRLKADGTDEYRMSWKRSNCPRIRGPNATGAS